MKGKNPIKKIIKIQPLKIAGLATINIKTESRSYVIQHVRNNKSSQPQFLQYKSLSMICAQIIKLHRLSAGKNVNKCNVSSFEMCQLFKFSTLTAVPHSKILFPCYYEFY